MSHPVDFVAMAEGMAQALGLPLPEAYQPGVTANLDIAYRLAPLFLEHALDDEAESAAVYVVGEGR